MLIGVAAALIGLSATACAVPQSLDALASSPVTAGPGTAEEVPGAAEGRVSRAEREAAAGACDDAAVLPADQACAGAEGAPTAAARAAAAAGAAGAAAAPDAPADPAPVGAGNAAAGAQAPGPTAPTGGGAPAGSAAADGPAPAAGGTAPAARRPAAKPAPAPRPGAAAPAPDGIAWGSSVMQYGDESYDQAFGRVQNQLRPEVIRVFTPGQDGPRWPGSVAGTRPMVISFKMPPRQVLAGAYDAKLAAFFAATPRLTYWSYWHEPEDDAERGQLNRAEYRAAWRRIAGIADASGKPLRATLILMGFTAKESSRRNWTDYYPGADVIDVLAWDCYAWDPGYTPSGVYGAARAVSQQAGKPWAIAETGAGSRQFAPAQRQAMLTAMSRWLATSTPRPEFVTYFDSDPDAPRIEHGWNVSRDPAAAAAWRAGQSG